VRDLKLVLVLLLGACTTGDNVSFPEPVCVAGTQQRCECLPDLRQGVQVCLDQGQGYGECSCGASHGGEGEGEGEGSAAREAEWYAEAEAARVEAARAEFDGDLLRRADRAAARVQPRVLVVEPPET